MRKFLAVAALGCAAIVTLAGCGGGDNREKNSVEELQAKYGYQWTDPDAPILNTDGRQKISFNIFTSKNASADDYNAMKVLTDLEDQTNVHVTWECVSESVYGEQKNLRLGDHDGIDAIYHAGMAPNEIIRYASRKVLLPISDYLDYMPNFKKILEERPDIRKQLTNAADGKIYSMPRVEEMGLKQNPNLLFLNANWTKAAIADHAAGLEGITADAVKDGLSLTAEQMQALLTYFKDHDMNGNSDAKDEMPMTFVYQNWQGNQCDLYGMFGINDNPNHRIIKDGQITYTVLDEDYFNATNYIHDWVSAGLIDQVSFEYTQDNFLSNGKNNGERYGAFYWWESETVVEHPENYICCAPLKGPASYGGENYSNCQTVCVSNTPEVDTGELVIFAGTPNVEVLLTYFDRYYLPQVSAQINYGPIGLAFEEEPDANGKLVAKEPPTVNGKKLTADEVRLQNAPLGVCYLTANEWQNTVNMEARAVLRLDRLGKYEANYVPANVKPVPNLQFEQAELNTLTRKETNVDNEMRSKLLIYLREGVSRSTWDSFISGLRGSGIGLDEVQAVYQAAYNRYISET